MDEENTTVKSAENGVSNLTIDWYNEEFLKQLAELEKGD